MSAEFSRIPIIVGVKEKEQKKLLAMTWNEIVLEGLYRCGSNAIVLKNLIKEYGPTATLANVMKSETAKKGGSK